MAPTVGAPVVALVLVSHSRAIAEGLADLAGQMAPAVALLPAGGTDDGGLGTGFERVLTAIEEALGDGRSVVVLTDLGSAVLTAESVLEALDPDDVDRVRVVPGPFVEAAVEAAVIAQGGGDLAAVEAAVHRAAAALVDGRAGGAEGARADGAAGSPPGSASRQPRGARELGDAGGADDPGGTGDPDQQTVRGTAVLRNRLGLHARPAAALARTAAAFASRITVNGADARSVLALIALGAVGGTEVTLTASGPDARRAVNALEAEIEEGFGEA